MKQGLILETGWNLEAINGKFYAPIENTLKWYGQYYGSYEVKYVHIVHFLTIFLEYDIIAIWHWPIFIFKAFIYWWTIDHHCICRVCDESQPAPSFWAWATWRSWSARVATMKFLADQEYDLEIHQSHILVSPACACWACSCSEPLSVWLVLSYSFLLLSLFRRWLVRVS